MSFISRLVPVSSLTKDTMVKEVVIITTGQPSTNPRMLKEYEALKEEGYVVKVLYCFWARWAEATDSILFNSEQVCKKDFLLIGGSPSYQKWKYYYSRIRNKICKALPLLPKEYALSRTTFFLEKAALRERADCYIAHNLGALPAAVKAGKKYQAKVGFDAEDYHRGEHSNLNTYPALATEYIEDKYLPQCSYITAASPLIGKAYKKLYPSLRISVINNVFSKKYLQKLDKESNKNLQLFWFSQRIGPNRGLETAVKAIEILKERCRIELHLMGTVSNTYASQLTKLTTKANTIHFIPPVPPHEVFEQASKFDVGLSLEIPETENRNYCLTNKLFTYLLSGNCIILSNTNAQKSFLKSYPGIGYIFETGNEIKLAEILWHLHNNRKELYENKANSLRIASEYLNWENESQKLKIIIEEQLK